MIRAGLVLAALCAGLGSLPVLVEAQYFGRNKVLWEQFDFEVLETEHFRIHYYPPDAEAAPYVARMAERWYTRLSGFFDHEFTEQKSLIIYQDHADFQQTVITPGIIGEGTGGFTESVRDRIVLPLTGINADNDHVIGHELVHAFQFDIARQAQRQRQQARLQRLPLWMTEGLAEYLSQGRVDPATALQMRDAVLHERLPDPAAFLSRSLNPYHYGQAVWAYVGGRWGDEVVRRLFMRAMVVGVNDALEAVLNMPRNDFWADFHGALRSTYQPVLDQRQTGREAANPLLDASTTHAAVNVAPSLSPDGQWIAFLSSRELALELFLADADTGEVERRLVRAEADPHFDNLSFLDSSVAWSPDGRRLAFGAFARGERRIAIYDLERGRVERRLDLPGIKGMRHAAWSPDGRSLVFSAVEEGASDLYGIELQSGELRRLTDDAYSAIQPVFSPSGDRIAFVTDRGPDTELDRLSFGPMRLALLDLESGSIEALPIFTRGKQTDPRFSPDGESLYFIGEPDGVPDVFRYDLESGRVTRLTRLKTGAAGITATSPALSVAADAGMVAFSVLEDGDWSIYSLEPGAEPVSADAGGFVAGTLPPLPPESRATLVEDYLARPSFGLPPSAADYPSRDYRSRISLANLGPATVGVSSGSAGVGAGGALSAYFTDPLNRHQISTTVMGGSTQSGLLDFEDSLGLEAAYLNQTRRLQWGVRGSRVPFLRTASFISTGTVDVDGMEVSANIVERLLEVVKLNEASLFGRYPLSLNNRIEAATRLTSIDFEREVERLVFPQGFAPFREQFGVPSPESVDLQSASLAFVRDTSRFGVVSPASGMRFRAEVELTGGDLDYRTTRLDYRRYFFRRPLTFAFRLLHVGRRGSDAGDFRLPPLDIGRSTLVRGYEPGSFDLSECTPTPEVQGCPELNRLTGSRIAVMNFELRVPLLGTEDFGIFDVPYAPTEAMFFIDAGAAWTSEQSVDVTFERDTAARVPVVSAGIAARSLILGSLPIELYYAVPLQRPEEDGMFGFSISVGW